MTTSLSKNSANRRSFLKKTVLASTALSYSRILGANERIRVAAIGLGGQGRGNAGRLGKVEGVEIAVLCDADTAQADEAKKAHGSATIVQDLRKVMEDKSIDAVAVSTCNHWHVLASVWACQAGKDVYVEKPISHNIWEGRKLVEAARKYNRIVQGGTQQRSDPFHAEVKAFLDSGKLGKIKYVRCNHLSKRASIGKRPTPITPPSTVDYDLWLGPAKDEPILREKFHYDWHWVWNTGNGELGNWGPHIIDDLRNVVFRDKIPMPKRVLAGGGRFGWDDAGTTPNAHFIYYDTGDIPVVMAVHNLPRGKGVNASDFYRRRKTNAFLVVECEDGYYAGGRGGGIAYSQDGKAIQKFSGTGGGNHADNFIKAVRSRNPGDLNAEVEKIHYSSAWCHLGNLSWQLGKSGDLDQARSAIKEFQPWTDLVDDFGEHMKANEIALESGSYRVGSLLEIDAKGETLTGATATPEALALVHPEYRKGFEVPDKV